MYTWKAGSQEAHHDCLVSKNYSFIVKTQTKTVCFFALLPSLQHLTTNKTHCTLSYCIALSVFMQLSILWTYPLGGAFLGRQQFCKYQGPSHYLLLSRCGHYWSVKLMICNELCVTHVQPPLLSWGPLIDKSIVISFTGKPNLSLQIYLTIFKLCLYTVCSFTCCVLLRWAKKKCVNLVLRFFGEFRVYINLAMLTYYQSTDAIYSMHTTDDRP